MELINPLDECVRAICAACNFCHHWIMEGLERGRIKRRIENLSILEKYIIMLLGVNQAEPIPDLLHLKAELLLCAKIDPELQKYLDEHGGIKLP